MLRNKYTSLVVWNAHAYSTRLALQNQLQTSIFLARGIDVNKNGGRYKFSIFEWAIAHALTPVVQLMIPYADLNAGGGYPLKRATMRPENDLLDLLIASGADTEFAIMNSGHLSSVGQRIREAVTRVQVMSES